MDIDLLKKLHPFFHKYPPLVYKKGQVILRPEDKIENIYFIEKGYIKFYILSPEGKELTYLIYRPGYLFPVIYAFLGEKNKYYFEALTPVVLRKIPREIFTRLAAKNPDITFLLSQEIVRRFVELMDRAQFYTFGRAYENVADVLYTLGKNMGTDNGKSLSINLPLGHKDIAAIAGLTRETVSIEMKNLQEQGLIIYGRNHIVIKDTDKFRQKTGI